jgi:hypothetical protein
MPAPPAIARTPVPKGPLKLSNVARGWYPEGGPCG